MSKEDSEEYHEEYHLEDLIDASCRNYATINEARPEKAGSFAEMLALLKAKRHLRDPGSYSWAELTLKGRCQVRTAEYARRAFADERYEDCQEAIDLIFYYEASDAVKARAHMLCSRVEMGKDPQTRMRHSEKAVQIWTNVVERDSISRLPPAQAEMELSEAVMAYDAARAELAAKDLLLDIGEAMADVGIDMSPSTPKEAYALQAFNTRHE